MRILDRDNVQLKSENVVVLSGVLEAPNDVLGPEIDGAFAQSVSVQVVGTFTGTIVFEVSNDGINWVSKNLVSSAGSSSSQLNGPNLMSGDIGARYFRARASVLTAGTPTIFIEFSPESQSNLASASTVNVANTPNVSAAMRPVSSGSILTSTNLAASASYTQTAVDRGTDATFFDTRIRPMVRHLAGLAPGYLILQESADGTNWTETRRAPVPSDNAWHTFDWPVHLRFWRLAFSNGATAQTAFSLGVQSSRGDGSSIDIRNVLPFVLSQTALAANASVQTPVIDLGTNHDWSLLRVAARADVTGMSFYPQWSDDGTNFWTDANAVGTVSNINLANIEGRVLARYFRIQAVNGATPQTSMRLWATLVSL